MATVQVRYIGYDVDTAIEFYTKFLDFNLDMHPAPPIARLVAQTSPPHQR